MPWTSLRISPGIVRNGTRYSSAGTWYDCSLVRFRDGFPERWAGWQDAYPPERGDPPDGEEVGPIISPGFTMAGHCRSMHRHGTLDGRLWVSAGTSRKFYMVSSDLRYDVTPYDPATYALGTMENGLTLGANPLTTTAGSNEVVITHSTHNHFTGNYVELLGVVASVGGIPATDFCSTPPAGSAKEHLIIRWIDENHYVITVAHDATSSVSGGGSAVAVRYILPIGSDDALLPGGGWGQDIWGHEFGWGSSSTVGAANQMGVWTQDNWGEDLVACPLGGAIYYWKNTLASSRMIEINTIPANYLGTGSPPAVPLYIPDVAQFIIVSHRDRHLIAFGTSAYLGGGVEPMSIRWCSQENFLDWNDADTTGTAGTLPLSNGSRFISAIATTREILVWSDQALYSLQYIGAPLIYVADILERWSDICGLKARCSFNGIVYWMGRGGFYAYSGRVEKIPCPVWDEVAVHLNKEQMSKVYAGSNQKYNEVIFFYPSTDSVEIDRYVAFDVVQQIWTIGSLARTCWMDIDALSPTLATEPGPVTSRIFEHDRGSDDGSTEPPSPIEAFIECGPIELSAEGAYDKGDKMMFVRKIMPDVTFRDIETSTTAPSMYIVLKMQNEPGSTFGQIDFKGVQRTARIPIEQFIALPGDAHPGHIGHPPQSRVAYVRLRGRSLTLRAESNTLGSEWRLGITRIDARTDGQK